MTKQNLVEIKKGQVGTGLLIENDGYVSIDMPQNRQLKESIGSKGTISPKDLPNPFIVSAVFQKYGVENANGRVYPEDILKREVEKYQQAIKERRAYGECYRPEAMILTESGWKHLYEVKEGENVITLNPETDKIELQKIKKVIKHDFNGELLRIKSNSINDVVTPNHEYPLYDRNYKFRKFIKACDIEIGEGLSHFFIPKTGNWEAEEEEFFTIPSISEEALSKIVSKKLKEKYSSDLVIPMEIFAKFMGIYLSEGSHSKTNGYKVNIHQKKEEVCEEIEHMLNEWGIKYTININKNGNCKTFVISDMRLHAYVKQFGLANNKFVPLELKRQSKRILKIFYDWFVMGDGRVRGDKRRKTKSGISDDVFSCSKQLALDLNEIQFKIGYSGTFHEEIRDFDRIIEGRVIKKENSQNMFYSYRSLTKGIYTDKRFLTTEKVPYNGNVMCIEVPNHIWYVMDNGFCHWTKNCNHPSESSIDLGRIALNIIELHWEGHTLVGQMEIPISEGFRNLGVISCFSDMIAHWIISGLKVGVSSRALGSVRQQYGQLIVGDDLELVCWDAVSQPSTPGAWISMEPSELKQYVESEKKDGELIKEDKFSKFDNWLND